MADKMKKRKKSSVTLETYNPVYDPNYGKQFTICGHGVVHLEGEACDCGPPVGKPCPHCGGTGRVVA
jgi:hypothetical protein